MTTLNNSANDLQVFIAFHVATEGSLQSALINLEKLISNLFPDEQSYNLMSHATGHEESEIIYRIQKPLLSTNEDNEQFFKKIQTLLSISSELTPHFTQLSEQRKGDNK